MRKVILIFAIIITAAIGQAGAQTTEKAVRAALDKYDNAWNRKDVKAVSGILDENYIYFSSEGNTTSRARSLEFLASPEYVLTFVERSEVSIFGSGRTMIVNSRWKGKGTYSGGTIDDDERCGLVFTKIQKDWKLLSEHCTQIVRK